MIEVQAVAVFLGAALACRPLERVNSNARGLRV